MPSRGDKAASGGEIFKRVHQWVARIPRGKVATYGQLSELIDGRLSPVGIGWALRTGGPKLPWHRVVNAKGGISTEGETPGRQRALLVAEGVRFGPDGRIDLERHQWQPRAPKRRKHRGL
jgi:methylated-DNA-protein-cysteine methyltransferase-like protein